MQLRNFGAGAGIDDGVLAGELAVFSEPKAEALALALFGDMLQSDTYNGGYYSGRLEVTLSPLLTSALRCEEADARFFSLAMVATRSSPAYSTTLNY